MENGFFALRHMTLGMLLICSLSSCGQQPKTKEVQQIEENNMNIAEKVERILPEIPREKQVMYAIHVNSRTPYQLFFDDVMVDYEYYTDFGSTTVEVNTYLLKNGKHKIKLRMFARTNSDNGLLEPNNVNFNEDNTWDLFFTGIHPDGSSPVGYHDRIDYGKVRLPVANPPMAVPVWEQEFEVTVDQLPYELKGWSESEDLREWDQDKLKEEVVAYYEEIRSLLQNMEMNEVQRRRKRMFSEVLYVNYSTTPLEEFIQKNYDDLVKYWGGKMLPLENYQMNLYAEGRLVILEQVAGKRRSWPSLIGESEKTGTSGIRMYLHRPKGSKTFEIIRK